LVPKWPVAPRWRRYVKIQFQKLSRPITAQDLKARAHAHSSPNDTLCALKFAQPEVPKLIQEGLNLHQRDLPHVSMFYLTMINTVHY